MAQPLPWAAFPSAWQPFQWFFFCPCIQSKFLLAQPGVILYHLDLIGFWVKGQSNVPVSHTEVTENMMKKGADTSDSTCEKSHRCLMTTACEGHSLSFQQVRNKCHIWLNLSHLIQAFPLLLSRVSRVWHSKNGILLLSSVFAPTVPVNSCCPGWFREWNLLQIGINCAALNQTWDDFYLLL